MWVFAGCLDDLSVALHRATKWQSIRRQLSPNLPAEALRKPLAQPPVVIKPLRRSIPLIGFASATGDLRPIALHVPIRRENGVLGRIQLDSCAMHYRCTL